MQIEALGICNLSISRCSALALAFQGESWNNQAALIHCGKKEEKIDYRCGGRRSGAFSHPPPPPS